MLAHVAGLPVEEALQAAPALLAGATVIAGYLRATVARPRFEGVGSTGSQASHEVWANMEAERKREAQRQRR